MSDATPIDEALDGLSELAACDLRLAKRFCARIEALPEDEDDRANGLARSYQRMARSYRQSVALQLRFRRELKAEAKAEAEEVQHAHARRVSDRKSRLDGLMRGVLWDEYEGEEPEPLYEALLDLIDAAAERDDFFDTPIDVHVRVMSEALGLADAPSDDTAAASPAREGGAEAEPPSPNPPLFNGRLAPPMDLPPWADEDSS